jgi:hypothetical protein
MMQKLFGFVALIGLFLCTGTTTASAGQADARATALGENCKPKKIEIYKQSIGGSGEIIYRVTCDVPKTVGEKPSSPTPDSLLVSCVQSLCSPLRPVISEKK